MSFEIAQYLPDGLSLMFALGLIIISAFTSAVTAAFGLGGGLLLIAVMSLIMPAAIVVPVHGAVQLGSNGGRAFLRRKYIQWKFAGWFIFGSMLGAMFGGGVAAQLPDNIFKIAIALFLLYVSWVPKPNVTKHGALSTSIAGVFTSFIGMVTGISGPLVLSFLQHLKERREIIGTHALLLTCQNSFKLLVFIFLGFAFSDYLPLILAMVVSGFIGTYLGGLLLDKLPEKIFRQAFRFIITIVALDLLRRAIFSI